MKLDHALTHFSLDPAGLVGLDIGASTGGFTDVLLARGAARIYAVDSGTNQLAWKLRNDSRVVVLERTNARTLTRDIIIEPPGCLVCDVSFIGLRQVLPAALALAAPAAWLVALIKPQFEAASGDVPSGGVVVDESMHQAVQAEIHDWLNQQPGWRVLGLTPSPITGADGNREFLIAAKALT